MYVYIYIYIYPLHQKVDSSEGCFGCHKTAFSDQKRIFLKTKKADQKHCENWRVSPVQNSTNISECASEVSGENCCEI